MRLNLSIEEKEENIVAYFADGKHSTHNGRSTYAWTEKSKQQEQPTHESHGGTRYFESSYIRIISDNARYYHNKELREWAGGTRIKQIFIPPYSPNLNLIERLWKFLRKKFINTGFYRTKEEVRETIRRFFDDVESFKEELESLLTLNFRLYNSQNISFLL